MKNKKLLHFFKKATSLFFAICFTTTLSACTKSKDYYQKQDFLMDTVLTQRIYGDIDAENVGEQALVCAQNYEKKFSAFLENSEIFKVNENSGSSVSVSFETAELLERSLEFSKQSQNGFKVSVFPLSSIWKKAIDQAKLPAEKDIAYAVSLVDDSAVSVDTQNLSVTLKSGSSLDLGAVAKGYTVDAVRKIYKENNVTGAICSIGSSAMLLYGTKPNGSDFKIGIRDPMSQQNKNLLILSLSSCVVSTSGGYERFAEIDGNRYHHIIDTKTGYPAESDLASVTVVGQDGAYCDYLSTELFLAGFETARKTAQENNLSVILVSNDKKVFVSQSLSSKVSSLSENYERVGA